MSHHGRHWVPVVTVQCRAIAQPSATPDRSCHGQRHHKAPADTACGQEHIAHHLDVTERHIRDIRREAETFPAPREVGTKLRWDPDVIRRWVAERDVFWQPPQEGKEPR